MALLGGFVQDVIAGKEAEKKKKEQQESQTIIEALKQSDLSRISPGMLAVIFQTQSDRRRRGSRRQGGTLLTGPFGLEEEERKRRKRLLGA